MTEEDELVLLLRQGMCIYYGETCLMGHDIRNFWEGGTGDQCENCPDYREVKR